MHIVKLKATSKDEIIKENLELTIFADEIELIHQFLENVNRLRDARILENGIPVLTNIKWEEESGFSFEFSEFDCKDISELLHVARPIILDKEPASFKKVCDLLGKKGKGTVLAKHLKSLRNLYVRGEYQPYFQFAVNNTPLFHDETLKLWLNGAEYHQDKEKKEHIEGLEKILSKDITRSVFLSQLSGKLKSIFLLAHLTKLILEKSQS